MVLISVMYYQMVLISVMYQYFEINKIKQVSLPQYFSESLIYSCALRLLEGNCGVKCSEHFFFFLNQETICLLMFQRTKAAPGETMLWNESSWITCWFTSSHKVFLFLSFLILSLSFQSLNLSISSLFCPFSHFLSVQICGVLILSLLRWRGGECVMTRIKQVILSKTLTLTRTFCANRGIHLRNMENLGKA